MTQPIPFGQYFLLERETVGGMAEVFKAKATGVEGFERLVAVKRILPSIAEDEEFITMFIDEAKIAVQLTHANIAQIFDLGKVDDSYFIALEHVRGKDMRAVFNRARQRSEAVPVPMACYIIMKVCEGLDYAHNKRDAAGQFLNLVHRDVSPQNLLVSYEGEVKVIDFGIAKAAGKVGKTQAGILKGKFGYMSPEQVQGQDIDRRSDIFGLGICLYELLTGERLFVAETDFATLEKVRNVEIMPPSTYNRRIPEELEQIVLKGLARDPAQRPQTAMELHDELQSFLYTSGSFFGRKDLSGYMHRVFGQEIARENTRDQQYAQMELVEETTGLHSFDELNQVSTVSALNEMASSQAAPPDPGSRPPGYGSAPVGYGSAPPGYGSAPPGYGSAPGYDSAPPVPNAPPSAPRAVPPPPHSAPPAVPPRPNKSTLLGMPHAPRTASRPTGSIPPPFPPAPSNAPASQPRAPNGKPSADFDMGWDDEELSTQIYDRPEDFAEGMMAGGAPQSLPSHPPVPPHSAPPYAAGSFPPGQHFGAAPQMAGAPIPNNPSFPPAPGAQHPGPPPGRLPPGNPSPFDSAPQFPQVAPAGPFSAPTYDDEMPQRSPRTIGIAVLSVVAIVGLIVGGLAIFQPAQPGVIHLRANPADAKISLDSVEIPGTSPFVLQDIVPDQQHTVWVDKQGYHRWSSKVELQPGQTMVLPPVTLRPFESGFALDSVPSGATVLLDGNALAELTPVRLPELKPGNYTVQLQKEGYLPWEIPSLHVTEGTVLELPKAVLTPQQSDDRGRQRRSRSPVRAAPATPTKPARAATTSQGSSSRREQSRPKPRPAPPAVAARPEPEPEPEAEAEVAEAEVAEAEVAEVEVAEAEVAKPSGHGKLQINSRPWSTVFIDDKHIGNTPQMNVQLPAGSHTVTLVNDDFGIRKTIRITIKPGEVVRRVLTLNP